ncbi:MAG: hypothetical protein M0P31_06445 [Solirubrobacteraceae bacterium]|nr:hypothetical protein [Solirubrobacteraceae bacterium]
MARTWTVAVLLAVVLGAATAVAPGMLRLVLTGVVLVTLISLCLVSRPVGVIATFVFLTFVAFVRRLLIEPAGWWPTDPLILVGFGVAAFLFAQLFFLERRRLAPDLLSKLVLVVLLLALVQVFNPLGGGPVIGAAGFLFMGTPLVWFFVGRETVDARFVQRIMVLVVAMATAIGLYGLVQLFVGFPPWDEAWLDIVGARRSDGYNSLNVGGKIRAFGTFSSFVEYATYLSVGLVLAIVLVARKRFWALLVIPALAYALFMSSSRTPVLTAMLALVTIVAMRSGSLPRTIAVALASLVLLVGAATALGPLLEAGANSGDEFISHQVGGFADPTNAEESTLIVHLEFALEGVKFGLTNPLGHGTGATNRAGQTLGDFRETYANTEMDFSNAFVSLGAVGGIAYLGLMIVGLTWAMRHYFAGHRMMLPVVAVLVVNAGQWGSGGHYALSPLNFILLGYVASLGPPGRRRATAAPTTATPTTAEGTIDGPTPTRA